MHAFNLAAVTRSISLNVPARARARARPHSRWSWSSSSCRWILVDLNANLATGGHGSAFEEGSHMFSLTGQKCHAVYFPERSTHVRAHAGAHGSGWSLAKVWPQVTRDCCQTVEKSADIMDGNRESVWNVTSEDGSAKAVHSNENYQLERKWKKKRSFFFSCSRLWGSKHFPC